MADQPLNEDFLRLAATARENIDEVGPAEARAKQRDGAILIDVRDAEELQEKPALPGAVNISRGRLELKIADAVPDKDMPLVLYCYRGNRGALAADSLRRMGYRNVFNLAGGAGAWWDEEKKENGK